MNTLESNIKTFFSELVRLSIRFPELTDTEVRESLHLVLNHFFVWGEPIQNLPVSYGMFSAEGDQSVAKAVNELLISVHTTPDLSKIPKGKPRLDLLQVERPVVDDRYYDEFIGHADQPLPLKPLASYLFESGEYD